MWNSVPNEQATVTWTGGCASGIAEGRGELVWRFFDDGKWKEDGYVGEMKGGRIQGHVTSHYAMAANTKADTKTICFTVTLSSLCAGVTDAACGGDSVC